MELSDHNRIVIISLANSHIRFADMDLSNYELRMVQEVIQTFNESFRSILEVSYPLVFKQLREKGMMNSGKQTVDVR